jgi:pyruvate-formate lyase
MATISKRKDCTKEIWRVQIRKTGFPAFSAHFTSYEEAKKWADNNEKEYLSNPNIYRIMNKNIDDFTVDSDLMKNHPEYKDMLKEFKEIAETYFQNPDISPELFSEATQKIYQVSLKHSKNNTV